MLYIDTGLGKANIHHALPCSLELAVLLYKYDAGELEQSWRTELEWTEQNSDPAATHDARHTIHDPRSTMQGWQGRNEH